MNARQCRSKASIGALLALVFLSASRGTAQSQPGETELQLQVIDENGELASLVEVVLDFGHSGSQRAYSDTAGRFELHNLHPGQIHPMLSKRGFFRTNDRALDLALGINEVSLALQPRDRPQETLEVQSEAIQINPIRRIINNLKCNIRF